MKRKANDTPCRIYSYGIRLEWEAEEVIVEVLKQATDYYNQLAMIENGRRDAYRAARTAIVPEYAAAELAAVEAELALEEARAEILSTRRKARANVRDADVSATVKALAKANREAWARVKELRVVADADDGVVAEGERINDLAKALSKNLYQSHGLFWMTKGRTIRAFEAARKAARGRVKWKRFEPSGGVGGQILKASTGYMTTTSVYDGRSQFFQIDPLPADSWDTRAKRRKAYTRGRLRVESFGRDPVWLEFDLLMHRPLPPDGLIKNVWVQAVRCGLRTRYHLQMTIESDAFAAPAREKHHTAVALTWKRDPHTQDVHVATTLDAAGSIEHLSLPRSIFDRFDFADSLRSASDIHFDAARDAVRTWFDLNDAPEWLTEATATMGHWRSHKKLARVAGDLSREAFGYDRAGELWAKWKTERLRDSLDLFADYDVIAKWFGRKVRVTSELERLAFYLELWRRKNAHLYQWESDVRRKAQGHRDDIYRAWVARMRGRRWALNKGDLKAASRKANPEDEDMPSNIRLLRSRAAPGKLAELLKQDGAVEVAVAKPKDMADLATPYARCVAVLDAVGEDTTDLRESIALQRAALQELRNTPMAAE